MSSSPLTGGRSLNPLSVRLVSNAVVYPTIRVASHPGKLLMGVYDENGDYVDDTALNRRAGEQGAPVPPGLFPDVTDAEPPAAIYAGTLYFHFGHFLLESLARAWYAHRHPDVPFVWAGQHDWQGIELRHWQREILDILEIGNPTRVIADPSRFELLHIPDIGYRYDDTFHPEHAEFLGRYQGPAQVPGHRLWLSRSNVGSGANDLNSGPTERRLAAAGWTIADPEVLSVHDQLDHLSRAEIVAGEEGSAFHTLILLKDVAHKRLQVLRRHGREHGNMRTIGDARQLDQTFYSLERQLILKAEGRFVSKVTPNSSEILDLLGIPVPLVPDHDIGADLLLVHEAVLAQTLATLEPERFLDVGALSPDLVVGSSAAIRVAVSPRFDYDPRAYAGAPVAAAPGEGDAPDPTIDFYELGLKQYADLFHQGPDRFDVIRLTGLEFEPIMEAFRASKRLAHQDTTWLLGSGHLAARVALAIHLTHAGFTVRRLLVGRTSVFLARRVPGEPTNHTGVGKLSAHQVQKRLRWVRPTTLGRLRPKPKTT